MPLLKRKDLIAAASNIQMLILDVDGILTDGRIVYTSAGEQVQAFHVHDGFGIKLLMKSGVDVVLLSARGGTALEKRANELGIEALYQGKSDKLAVYEEIKGRFGVQDQYIAFMGDDWMDLPVLKKVGLAVTVADCAEAVKDQVHYITSKKGGMGAVREVCDLILEAKGMLDRYLERFLR